jgi:glycine oxidase
MRVLVKGAGVAGLAVAHELARRGAEVTVAEKRPAIGGNASWLAGGMLAPWCERANAEQAVVALGQGAADWWDALLPGQVCRAGTLVLAHPRDAVELKRFAGLTSCHRWLAEDEIAGLEPDLAGRFRRGLFFDREAHLDPRRAMTALADRLAAMGVGFIFNADKGVLPEVDRVVDCTGIAARDPELRGVRGEMLVLHTRDVALNRTVRLLHPRHPIYVVPRDDHHFMVGATMIESDNDGPITARSAMELLNTAYALHPAFGEAEIVETGAALRPAYPDNLPRVTAQGRTITVNGFYRHGFLLAPSMAMRAAELIFTETAHEADRQRRSA